MATRMKESKLEPLSVVNCCHKSWFERYEFFLLAGDTPAVPELENDGSNLAEVTAAKKKHLALFIARVDESMYKLLKSLTQEPLENCSYEQCKKLILDHLAPAPTKFAQRHKLRNCVQESEESAATFISRLRTIANECDFDNYNEAILDQLLTGLRDQKVVSELLTKENLTLAMAVKEALSREQAGKEAQFMNSTLSSGGESSKPVNFVRKSPTFKRTVKNPYVKKGEGSGGKQKGGKHKLLKCNRCGLRGHEAENCQVRCHICKKIGHISKKCKQNRNVHNIEQGETSSESYEFGMDKNCENVLDDELYSEYYDDCHLIETVYVKRVADTCSLFNSDNLDSECVANKSLCVDSAESFADFNNLNCESDLNVCNSDSVVSDDVNLIDLTVSKPCVEVQINNRNLRMEFDTGSAVSVVSKQTLLTCGLANLTLAPSRKTLRVANGEIKTVDGCATVTVELNGNKAHDMQLYVAEDFPSLFGRPWIVKFCGQNWLDKLLNTRFVHNLAPDKSREVSAVSPSCQSCSGSVVDKSANMLTDGVNVKNGWKCTDTCTSVDQCRSIAQLKQSEVFKPGLGLVKGVEASLVLKDNAKPIMLKARTLPYALRDMVEQELNSMVDANILSKVEDSPWGTPLVPVKKDGGLSVRICGDYKSTLNKCVSTKQYPLPTIEECFNAVQGGKRFSKIDIKKAYNNLLIREEDRVLTTLNTHKGLYQWNRLPYGISSASAIFQSVMDDTLTGIPMTCCRIDDILVSGRNDEEHLMNLNNVIIRLERRGFKCKVEKSCFMQEEVVYLGHVVSADGIKPVQSKVESLLKAPEPRNVDELISFLGAVNYYRRYLPKLSAVIAPLERLRTKTVKWQWTTTERDAFQKLKMLLSSKQVLTFYDPKLPLKVDTDASSGGIGAVLSHILPNGEERPIEFISRTLSPAERNYAQIDKEALAIVWALKRLHIYLYMRRFTLVTDHRALVRIFGDKPIPEMTAGRLTRWALFLMNYQYDIQYRNTKDHANADMLSRLPRPVKHDGTETSELSDMFALTMSETLLNAELVANHTRKDPILSKALEYTLNGWPKNLQCDGDLKALWNRRDELSHELGCLTWGARVIIPVKLRDTVMNILHAMHIGVAGIKSLARSYVYWPRIDTHIEDTARTCETCAKHGKNLTKIVNHPWAKTSAPFERVHADFAGPFLGSMWLLLVDTYSKWPEIIQMNMNTTSSATIRAFRSIFSRTGLPICLVTDNGPQFISEETERYLKSCGIKHVTVPTYSPKSNGMCERLVQTFKSALKKMSETSRDVAKNLYDFLLTYRNTPHSATGQTPAVLAFNRTLRSKLHQIKPADRQREMQMQSEKLQDVVNEHAKTREFQEQQPVFAKINDKGCWEQAKVIKRLGENSNNYMIQQGDRVVKKHADVIKPQLKPVIKLRRLTIPGPEKPVVMEELARFNRKHQKLEEKLDRWKLRAEVPESRGAEPPTSPSPVKERECQKSTAVPVQNSNSTQAAVTHQYNLRSRRGR